MIETRHLDKAQSSAVDSEHPHACPITRARVRLLCVCQVGVHGSGSDTKSQDC